MDLTGGTVRERTESKEDHVICMCVYRGKKTTRVVEGRVLPLDSGADALSSWDGLIRMWAHHTLGPIHQAIII